MEINLREKHIEIINLRESLKRRLARRGLKLRVTYGCTAHGPHPGMPETVYIVSASSGNITNEYLVTPKAVYLIPIGHSWYEKHEILKRIYIEKSKRKR